MLLHDLYGTRRTEFLQALLYRHGMGILSLLFWNEDAQVF